MRTALGAAAMGTAGCSSFRRKSIPLNSRMADFSFEVTNPKPSGGAMPMGEIGGPASGFPDWDSVPI